MSGEAPRWLMDGARLLLDADAPVPPGVTEQAVATLARQALEGQLMALCRGWDPDWPGTTFTAPLLCLPVILHDRDLAVRVSGTWKQLTLVCHHQPGAPAPTREDLHSWLDTVEEFLAAAVTFSDLQLEITLDQRPDLDDMADGRADASGAAVNGPLPAG